MSGWGNGRSDTIGKTATKVWREGDTVKVLYHQTVVVEFTRDQIILRNGGWHTKTTMLRWNQASRQFGLGFSAYSKRGKWLVSFPTCVGGTQEYVDGTEMVIVPATPLVLPDLKPATVLLDRYHKTDGWRGYAVPGCAIAGSSDTGMWSDSPCPSDRVEAEINRFREAALEAGFPTALRAGETSNVFCAKVWVTVNARRWHAAARWAAEWIKDNDASLNYLHAAEQDQVLKEAA